MGVLQLTAGQKMVCQEVHAEVAHKQRSKQLSSPMARFSTFYHVQGSDKIWLIRLPCCALHTTISEYGCSSSMWAQHDMFLFQAAAKRKSLCKFNPSFFRRRSAQISQTYGYMLERTRCRRFQEQTGNLGRCKGQQTSAFCRHTRTPTLSNTPSRIIHISLHLTHSLPLSLSLSTYLTLFSQLSLSTATPPNETERCGGQLGLWALSLEHSVSE